LSESATLAKTTYPLAPHTKRDNEFAGSALKGFLGVPLSISLKHPYNFTGNPLPQKPGCHLWVLFPWALRRIIHERFSPQRRGVHGESGKAHKSSLQHGDSLDSKVGWRGSMHDVEKLIMNLTGNWFSTFRRIGKVVSSRFSE